MAGLVRLNCRADGSGLLERTIKQTVSEEQHVEGRIALQWLQEKARAAAAIEASQRAAGWDQRQMKLLSEHHI